MAFWYKKIVSEYGNIPTVICGNKVDKSNRKVNKNIISHHIMIIREGWSPLTIQPQKALAGRKRYCSVVLSHTRLWSRSRCLFAQRSGSIDGLSDTKDLASFSLEGSCCPTAPACPVVS